MGANASAGAVMATLSAALAATAVGLIVAMPAVAVFNYFNRRIKTLQTGADALVHVLLAHLGPESQGGGGPDKGNDDKKKSDDAKGDKKAA